MKMKDKIENTFQIGPRYLLISVSFCFNNCTRLCPKDQNGNSLGVIFLSIYLSVLFNSLLIISQKFQKVRV